MRVERLETVLAANTYPGRGIMLGCNGDRTAVMVYFIMGRSENSRNRIFVKDGEGIRTEAFDPKKVLDPSLIIYNPVRVYENATIVTNGDQTDTIYDAISQGKSFQSALRTRTFEPDAPNYTPRISGLLRVKKQGFAYRLSILKSANGSPNSVQRFFYEYPEPVAGEGHLIHTYKGDGNPIPSFEGEPIPVAIRGTIDELTENVWESLNKENKISLFVRFLNTETGAYEMRIVNKNM